ncbi:MAG: recombinase family protein [Lachnospiraceae bacterium]|nr:recombinase family protein [Lachnospiraceae bacterium]
MARKSRKETAANTVAVKDKAYRTAVYVRLSCEDERKIESESVENQLKYLLDYVEKEDSLKLADSYVDRGITGTKFDRPEFNRMIGDIRAGKIDCVVVRDLSRLGRNYLEAGDYIEKIFPFFGIRFISVTDHYDSIHSNAMEDGLVVPLKNLINEAYAKDISKKISSTYQNMYRNGIYPGANVAYGYRLDPDDHHKLLVDENVKDLIVRIFTDYAGGKSMAAIAKELNAEGVPAPTVYKKNNGIITCGKYDGVQWVSRTVMRILENVIYTGDIELSKTENALYKGITKSVVKDKKDRFYFADHHEAIIDHELFDRVQEIRTAAKASYFAKRDRYKGVNNQKEDLFHSMLYCGHCGNKMNLSRRTQKLVNGYGHYSTYLCRRSNYYGDADPKKYVKAEVLEEMVRGLIQTHIRAYLDAKGQLKKLNRKATISKKRQGLEKDLGDAVKRRDKIGEMMANLYEDFSDDIFSEEEYLEMKQGYMREHELLEKQIAALQSEIETYKEDYAGDAGLDTAAEKYDGFEELTAEIVKTFITRITCYASDRFEVEYSFGAELESFLALVQDREGAAA